MDFETRAIHDGQEPDPATGAVTAPIYQTSTYVQEAVGKNKGYDYSRAGNPTRTALETCLASLESADHGLAFSSGLGATTTIMHLVSPGERVVLRRTTCTAASTACSRRSTSRRATTSRSCPPQEIERQPRRPPRREDAHRLARDADEPAPERDRHRRPPPTPRTRSGRSSSSTTPSRRRTSSARSSSAPTSSSTRRPSTSAVTRT